MEFSLLEMQIQNESKYWLSEFVQYNIKAIYNYLWKTLPKHSLLMCDFIDESCFNMYSNHWKSKSESQNQQKINDKILFQDSIYSFRRYPKQSFQNKNLQALCLIRQIHSNVDILLALDFSNSQCIIKAKTIYDLKLELIRSKEIRKILIKQLLKRSFLTMIEPYRISILMQTGQWFMKTPAYCGEFSRKQFHNKLDSLIESLVKKMTETLLYFQKITKFIESQLTQKKKEKINQTWKYYTRCTTAPSLSIKSDCAQYQSAMIRYAASRFDLQDLDKNYHQTQQWFSSYFQNSMIYGCSISKGTNVQYLGQISLQEKQRVQQEISIPAFTISKSKQNKYNFNHCYFYKDKYEERKIAEGGNSQAFVLRPDVYEYSSSGCEFQIAFQKKQNVSKYISKHLIYKKMTHKSSIITNKDKQLVSRQTEIVSYFRGGSCLFLPKYYLNVEKQTTYNKILFIDYLNGDTLDNFLAYNSQTISLYTKLYLILQVLQALRFINSYGIVHLDIKENNIIVLKRMICKIFDFGESYHYKVCGESHKPKYTRLYASPEVATTVKGRLFTQKSDVFSLGIMIHNILFKKYPYFFADQTSFERCNFEGKLRDRTFYLPEQIQEYGHKDLLGLIYQLLLRCIDMSEPKRPYLDWITVIIKSCFNIFTSQ